MEQKIKQDKKLFIGKNIREIRKSRGIGQTEFAQMIQLSGEPMTRESLVKIERGIQHIKASQLKTMKELLNTTYNELLK